MDAFEKAMDLVERWEGGWSDHAADPGGKTKWGVTIRTIRDKALDFNGDGRHTAADLRAMTREQARAVYRSEYWGRAGCDELPAPLALVVFNSAVNQGVGRSVRFLQRASGASADGVFGPKTRQAARDTWEDDPRRLVREFLTKQLLHYTSLSIFATFGTGWLRRTVDVAMTSAAWHGDTGATAQAGLDRGEIVARLDEAVINIAGAINRIEGE